MRNARATLFATAAVPFVLACAHGYRDPDPSAGPTARVVIENPSANSVYISMTATVVHVYQGGPGSAKTYLGTVSVADREGQILVAADRPVLFHLSINDQDVGKCDAENGLVPRAGATYRLIVGEHFQRKCSLQLLDATGSPTSGYGPSDYQVR